MPGYSNYL